MTCADIGSFLGMALETVGRSLAGMQAQSDIEIKKRRVRIPDLETFAKRYGAWLSLWLGQGVAKKSSFHLLPDFVSCR
jgi:hypothetical protein